MPKIWRNTGATPASSRWPGSVWKRLARLLEVWETSGPLSTKEKSSLVRKQTAVSCLLLGGLIVRKFPNGRPDLTRLYTAALTKEFNESDESQAVMAIRGRALEKRKQGAMYQDDDILTAVEDDFAETHVDSIFRIVTAAQQACTNEIAHRAGRTFYSKTG